MSPSDQVHHALDAGDRLPLPLAGEGWGGGACRARRLRDLARRSCRLRPSSVAHASAFPLPTLPRKRGRVFAAEG
jgi:hypothetical protein